jgi:hypothetical protein
MMIGRWPGRLNCAHDLDEWLGIAASRSRNMTPVACNLLLSEQDMVSESMARRSHTLLSHRRNVAS